MFLLNFFYLRSVTLSLLTIFFNHFIVFSPLGYLHSESGMYYCPESVTCSTLAKYRNFVDELPLTEEPEIFGVHENANIPWQVS
jgi:dynein heavy chain